MPISTLIDETLARIGPLDEAAMAAARARQDTLTKPLGSLGRLEDISILLAGIFGQVTPNIGRKATILAAGDHGVVEEGVSAYPQAVTPPDGAELPQRRRGHQRPRPPRRGGDTDTGRRSCRRPAPQPGAAFRQGGLRHRQHGPGPRP